jgi:DNA-binding protein YbaB
MTADTSFSLTDAITELRRQQERLQAVRSQLREVKTKVRSKDGMITVTLDGSGEVSSIAFNTAKFRRMAPAELGAALVETIGQARAQSREQMVNAYRPFIPAGVGLDDLFTGKGNLNRVFDDAVRKANDMLAHGPAGDLRQAAERRGGSHGQSARR